MPFDVLASAQDRRRGASPRHLVAFVRAGAMAHLLPLRPSRSPPLRGKEYSTPCNQTRRETDHENRQGC